MKDKLMTALDKFTTVFWGVLMVGIASAGMIALLLWLIKTIISLWGVIV